ncbi:MAG: DUF4388 domain-containing protein [Actinobacteria bacterium]|nr:DUF4388 domain-containing protein [Actinomycetota bacterium]
MQLQGHVRDVSLPEIFRLLKMGGRTGALKVASGKEGGHVYFKGGEVYYATSTVSGAPIGERLVRAGKLRGSELQAVLAEQRASEKPRLLGALLKELGLVSQEALEQYVREQIQDSVFNLFNWPEAEFQFTMGEEPPVADVVVSMDAEGVIMEGCRRVDEWELVMRTLGSLEKVPSLSAPVTVREVRLTAAEWGIACFADGHRDINTIVVDSGLDRFNTAKTIFGMVSTGLVALRDPTLELLGQKTAIALRGPIDIYNLTFLTTASTSDVSNHLRIEKVDDEEVEVYLAAAIREDDEDAALIYFSESRTPLSVVKRMALETSGFVVLVNINSEDSVVASRRDVALMGEIGDRPYVVASYASMADEKVTEDQVRRLLDLSPSVPVVACNIRSSEDATEVLAALRALIP